MSDAPIVPQDYLYGTKVVQIEDLRVARGMTRRPASACRHRKLVYNNKERRVWCSDCEAEVEAFDAFEYLVDVFASGVADLNRQRKEVADSATFRIISRAAKIMDQAWRSQKMAPLCPHCMVAILPEDVVGGVAMTSKSLVKAKRNKAPAKP